MTGSLLVFELDIRSNVVAVSLLESDGVKDVCLAAPIPAMAPKCARVTRVSIITQHTLSPTERVSPLDQSKGEKSMTVIIFPFSSDQTTITRYTTAVLTPGQRSRTNNYKLTPAETAGESKRS